MDSVKLSKFLSLVLRHKPDEIGIEVHDDGWVFVDELLSKMNKSSMTVDNDDLKKVVAESDKKRFSFNEDMSMIRANQGHSIKVQMEFEQRIPPDLLYHGTVEKFLKSIESDGLKKMNRHHVHLSSDYETATMVGSRRGKPMIIKVDAKRMNEDGVKFYISNNGVWLVDEVDVKYFIG